MTAATGKATQNVPTESTNSEGANGAATMDLEAPVKVFPKVTTDEIRHAFETGEYPYSRKMGRKEYEEEKARLQA